MGAASFRLSGWQTESDKGGPAYGNEAAPANRRVKRNTTGPVVLFLVASLFVCSRLLLGLGGVAGFGLFLSGLLLVRFGGFVAHGFGRFVGLMLAVADCLTNMSGDFLISPVKSRSSAARADASE
jgi:hypothetical protein